jgi:ribosomal protein S18 acetylase RimI-like enzyme
MRATPGYDPEIDVVLEDETGRFVSYCICWADDTTRIGYFEPVGTRPAFTGRGLGRAVILEGLGRLRERGMRTARVGTASINEGAARLYRSAGFQLVDREWFYTRAL